MFKYYCTGDAACFGSCASAGSMEGLVSESMRDDEIGGEFD